MADTVPDQRHEISRSDREIVFIVQKNGEVSFEVETPDGKVWEYDDYVQSVSSGLTFPKIMPVTTKYKVHPAAWAGAGAVLAVVVSHFIK